MSPETRSGSAAPNAPDAPDAAAAPDAAEEAGQAGRTPEPNPPSPPADLPDGPIPVHDGPIPVHVESTPESQAPPVTPVTPPAESKPSPPDSPGSATSSSTRGATSSPGSPAFHSLPTPQDAPPDAPTVAPPSPGPAHSPRAQVSPAVSTARPTPADSGRSHTGEERELKLEADAESLAQLGRVPDLGPRLRLDATRFSEVEDRYLDTPDRAFLRAGFVLRERTSRRDDTVAMQLTLKGLARREEASGGVHRRLEVEGPLRGSATTGDQSTWPGAVVDLAMVIAGRRLQRLETVVAIRQRRGERTLRGAAGEPLATLSLDTVEALGPSGSVAERWHEIELELLAVDAARAAEQDRAMSVLRKRAPQVSDGGKFDRALLAVAEQVLDPPQAGDASLRDPSRMDPATGIDPTMEMAEAGRLIWRRQLAALLLQEAGARRGDDIEYVHDYRVALRRARAADRLFGAFVHRGTVKPLLKHMKATASLLGAVRDADVALHKLGEHQDSGSRKDGGDLDALATHWRAQRVRAYDQLLPWLDGKRHRRFIESMQRYCASSGMGARTIPSPRPVQVRHVLPQKIWGRYARVRAYETLLADPATVEIALLHRLRIDCKRLRYAIEPVVELLDNEGKALIKQLKALQDHLGDLNDVDVARADLERARSAGVDADAIERYGAVQDAEEARVREAFNTAWLPFVAEASRARLGRALARI